MDDTNKPITLEELLEQYPVLLEAVDFKDFQSITADLRRRYHVEIPLSLWEVIEEEKEDEAQEQEEGTDEKNKRLPKPEHKRLSEYKTPKKAQKGAFKLEEHDKYKEIKARKEREWLEKKKVLGIGKDSPEWKRYSTNLEFDSDHPVDKLFPFKKVHSELEEETRQEFFNLHPELREVHEESEMNRRFNNPLEDPLYLGAMLEAKESTRAWYDRQVAQGDRPTATQIEHQFSIEKAKAAASFQNSHPTKAEIYKEQIGTIARAVDTGEKTIEEVRTEEVAKEPPSETVKSVEEKPSEPPREYMQEMFADERIGDIEEELQTEWLQEFENIQVQLLAEKRQELDRTYRGQYYTDRDSGLRIPLAEYMLGEYEHGKTRHRGADIETDLIKDAKKRLQQQYGRTWHPEVRRVIVRNGIPEGQVIQRAKVDISKEDVEQRFKEKHPEDYERYVAIQRSYDEHSAASSSISEAEPESVILTPPPLVPPTESAAGNSADYDRKFTEMFGTPPSTAPVRFTRTAPPISPLSEGDTASEGGLGDGEDIGDDVSENDDDAESPTTRSGSANPAERARRTQQRARQMKQRAQQARQNVQRLRQFAQNSRKAQQIAKFFSGLTEAAEAAATSEIWGPIVLVVVIILLLLLLVFGQDMTNSLLPGLRGRETIDDRTLPKVQIVKEGPTVVEIPRIPDPLPDDPTHTREDWSNVIVEYTLRVSYEGIAEDVVIDEPIPEGAQVVEDGTTTPFKKLDENGDTLRSNANPRDVRIVEWSLKELQRPNRTISPTLTQGRDLLIYTRSPYFLPTPTGDSDTTYSSDDLRRLNELAGRVTKYQTALRNLSANIDQQYTDPFLSVIWSGAIEKNNGNPYYMRCGSQVVSFETGCPNGFSSGQLIVAHGIQVSKANTFLNFDFENVYGVDSAGNAEKVREVGQRVVDLSGEQPLGSIKDAAGQPFIFPTQTVAELTYAARNADSAAQQAVSILLMDPDIAAFETARAIALDISTSNNWTQTLQNMGRNDLQAYANRAKTIYQQYAGNIVGTFENQTITIRMKISRDLWIANKAVGTAIGAQRRETRTIGELPNSETCGGFYAELKNPIRKNFGDPACDFKSNKDKVLSLLELKLGATNRDVLKWFAVIVPCESGFNANAYAGHAEVGTPDEGGAWGLGQMGSCTTAPGTGCDGKNGRYDKGDVPWYTQIDNMLKYNDILAANRKKWQYWACARQYWGE